MQPLKAGQVLLPRISFFRTRLELVIFRMALRGHCAELGEMCKTTYADSHGKDTKLNVTQLNLWIPPLG